METGRVIIPEEELKHIRALKKAEYLNELHHELLENIKHISEEELGKKVNTYFQVDTKIARYICAKYILRKFKIMTDIMTDDIKAYDEETKYYKNIGVEKIKMLLTEEFNQHNSKVTSEEILHFVRTLTYIEQKDIDEARNKDMIPFKNGIYYIKQKKLIPHDYKYLFDYQIPIIYNCEADCPIFDNFLKQVVKEEDITLIYDIMGLSLYPINILEKFFVFTGTGSNGKTVLINVLEHFIGIENKSAISLKQMTEDKFAVAKMYKKLLNVGADISGDIIIDSSLLKSASSKDSISGQFKFGQIFDFKPSATLVYGTNAPPLFKDNSDGMNRRPELIAFPYKFGNDKDIEEDPTIKKADLNILDKLITDDEMGGILNKALQHLHKILEDGQLSIVRSVHQSKKLYKKYSNSAIAFIEEFCEECPYIPSELEHIDGRRVNTPAEGFLFISDIFPLYKKWCQDNLLQIKPRNSFTKSVSYIDDWNIETGQKDRNDHGNQERSIRGVQWYDKKDQLF